MRIIVERNLACSLLYRLDEDARALKLATEEWWPWATGSGPALQAGFEYRPKRYVTGEFSTSESRDATLSHVRLGLGKQGRFCLGRTPTS
jgi:hypothetical protein